MKPPLSASQLVSQNHIFHINFWFLKDKKVVKPGKNLILKKKPEISLKVKLFGVGKKFVPLMRFFGFT